MFYLEKPETREWGLFGMQDGNWLRRQAIQIICALPEDNDDALKVLDLARHLIENFLGGGIQRPALVADLGERGDRERVVSLSSSIKGASF